MNAREFFDKVAAMRAAQKGFFSTKKDDPAHQQFLVESKMLEKEIDNEIERVKSIIGQAP